MIRNSRYTLDDAYETADRARCARPLKGLLPHLPEELEVQRLHRVVAGERLDHLADRYYGDPLKYWLICDANDEIFPDDLMVPGRILRIPRNRL